MLHQFKERLQRLIRIQWYELPEKLNNVALNEKDQPVWKWTSNKNFTVKSVYDHSTRDDRGTLLKRFGRQRFLKKS
jgi:hypothetical protein